MRIGYFIKNRGESLADTTYFRESTRKDLSLLDIKSLVEEACEHACLAEIALCHQGEREDGVVITLVVDGVETWDFKIKINFDPMFVAQRKEEK